MQVHPLEFITFFGNEEKHYGKEKNCIQGRRLFLRVCSAKTGKSAVEITPKRNLHAPLNIGNKVKTSTLNMQ